MNSVSGNLSKRVGQLRSTSLAEESKNLLNQTRSFVRRCIEYSRSTKSNTDKDEFIKANTSYAEEWIKLVQIVEEKTGKQITAKVLVQGPSNSSIVNFAKVLNHQKATSKSGSVSSRSEEQTKPPTPTSAKKPAPPATEDDDDDDGEDMMSFLRTEPPPKTPRQTSSSSAKKSESSSKTISKKKSSTNNAIPEDDGMDMFDFLKTDPEESKRENSKSPKSTSKGPSKTPSKSESSMDFVDFLRSDPEEYKKSGSSASSSSSSTTSDKKKKLVRSGSKKDVLANLLSSKESLTSSSGNLPAVSKETPPPTSSTSSSKPTGADQETNETEAEIEAMSKGFTFSELVDKLISSSITDGFQIEFLLTYRSICTSRELFNVIIEKFKSSESDVGKLRCLNLVKLWVDRQRSDFLKDKEELTAIFDSLAQYVKETEPKLIKLTEGIREKFTKVPETRIAENNQRGEPPTLPSPGTPLSFQTLEASEIAKQLSLIEQELFFSVNTWELLGQAWTKSNKEELSPNVCRFIDWFNKVNYWVQTEILTEPLLKNRIRVFSKWLSVIEHLQELNNFNGIYEIVSALQSSNIFRLTKTIQGLSSKKQSSLEKAKELLDVQTLRNALRVATTPVIPYLGMYLTDLIFLEDGNKSTTADGKINFRKRQLIARTIRKIQQFQNDRYPFQSSPEIKEWLQKHIHSLPFKEDTLYSFSLYLEPRAGQTQPPEMPEPLKQYIAERKPVIPESSKPKSNVAKKATEKLRAKSTWGTSKSKLKLTTMGSVNLEDVNPEHLSKILEDHSTQLNMTFKQQESTVVTIFDTITQRLTVMNQEITTMLTEVATLRAQTLAEIEAQGAVSQAGLDLMRHNIQQTGWVSKSLYEKEISELKARIQELQSEKSSAFSEDALTEDVQ
eukprot:TRINITY_DN3353_c0_g2_i3.p1 TRINITY_DN3353_c0_g2~~TRINITY_DN3353_c0_g2_i3.p1  ORF type:complete len:899 (-),score=245.74 TRINITY_DN3353_c0_g2_i3:1261-3957(-)